MMGSLNAFERNVHSQNGEDGVLAEIVRRLALPSPGTCVEFGASDGAMSNTLHLIEQGWRGVLIEQAEVNIPALHQLAGRFPDGRVQVLHRMVGFGAHDDLNVILARTDMPRDFDVLSIDIDGFDLQVWRALDRYEPKIVIIEVNSSIPLDVRQVHGRGYQGASFTSMLELGEEKGYRLACHTGNMIFVRADLAPWLDLPVEENRDPRLLFNYNGPPIVAAEGA